MTRPSFKRIANSPGLTIRFTFRGSIILQRAWRQLKQRLTRRFAFVPMQAKHTLHMRDSFIGDTEIMTVQWPNWKLLAKLCLMTRGYSSSKDTSSVVRGAGKSPHVALSARL